MGTSRNCSAAVSLLALALIAACHRPSPQEQAAKDAHDAALVEQAQHQRAPLQPLRPEPVSFAELARHDVAIPLPDDMPRPKPGDGCTFSVKGTPVLVAVPQFALMRSGGRLETFAADSGSTELDHGLQRLYAGGQHALELVSPGGDSEWSLIVRDRYDRVVYTAPADIACKSNLKR